MSVASQHFLPLQELSHRQMGHREWCPPLQLQQPAMLFQLAGHIKHNDLGTCTHLSLIPGPSWLFSSLVPANLAARPFPVLSLHTLLVSPTIVAFGDFKASSATSSWVTLSGTWQWWKTRRRYSAFNVTAVASPRWMVENDIAMGQNPGTVREHQNRWDLWMWITTQIWRHRFWPMATC